MKARRCNGPLAFTERAVQGVCKTKAAHDGKTLNHPFGVMIASCDALIITHELADAVERMTVEVFKPLEIE
ncbi:hypothetical protein V2J74_15745 [Pseudomonas alliivorans]|nr:hypothetical protein [Pseudomonas alliivorans]